MRIAEGVPSNPIGRTDGRTDKSISSFSITEEMPRANGMSDGGPAGAAPSQAKRQAGEKACCWSITINNPTQDDLTAWAGLPGLHWVREVKGQLERGENGTDHIQGCLKTTSVRFAQVKKALPRAHIEIARSPKALEKYVVKEGTRVAPIATTKVATAADLQGAIYQTLYYNGRHYFSTWSVCQEDFIVNVERHKEQILKYWELILDDAVSELIRYGYYGIEFVVSNPQVRTAFRKYLPDIMYRSHGLQDIREGQGREVSPQETSPEDYGKAVGQEDRSDRKPFNP